MWIWTHLLTASISLQHLGQLEEEKRIGSVTPSRAGHGCGVGGSHLHTRHLDPLTVLLSFSLSVPGPLGPLNLTATVIQKYSEVASVSREASGDFPKVPCTKNWAMLCIRSSGMSESSVSKG